MRKTDSKTSRQLVEGTTQNHRNNAELCLRRHAHCPRHHVFRHPGLAEHVPWMHQHRRAFSGTIVKESHDAGIIEVLLSDVIADLHAQVPCSHAPAQLLTCSVHVLQRHLAQRLQPSLPLSAQFQCCVIKSEEHTSELQSPM